MHGVVTNELLLQQVANGDREAFRALYDSTSGMLFSVCMSLFKNRARAEDLLQEAYLRIWDRASSFDPAKGSASTWLVVLTRRLALNELRKDKREGPSLDEEEEAVAAIPAELPAGDPIGKGRLGPCLEKLQDLQRQSVLLAYVYGYTNEELARRFNRPLGTVKSWLLRGLQDLRKCLQ